MNDTKRQLQVPSAISVIIGGPTCYESKFVKDAIQRRIYAMQAYLMQTSM